MMPRISNNGVLSPLKQERLTRKSNIYLPTQRYGSQLGLPTMQNPFIRKS
jgi:hypothetical protein